MRYIKSYKNIIFSKSSFLLVSLFLLLLISLPYLIHQNFSKQVYEDTQAVEFHDVAIVLGAGVNPDGSPKLMLRHRLDRVAELYNEDKITRIIVSGDNRFANYNEPESMKNYLISKYEIDPEVIFEDFAGRRTFDTCARASDIFQVEKAIVVSQGYHLPRTIFLCEHLGIETSGISSTYQTYQGQNYYKIREYLAIYKSIIDAYILEPYYVGGDVIDLGLDE